MRVWLWGLWLIFAASTAVGCGGKKGRLDHFREQVESYNEGIRWRAPERSAKHLPAEQRELFLEERYELDEDLRIGDYEIIRVKWAKDREKARVRIRYAWHLDSQAVVHKTTTEQFWHREGRGWLMVDEVRIRGAEMPGVAEKGDYDEAKAEEGKPFDSDIKPN